MCLNVVKLSTTCKLGAVALYWEVMTRDFHWLLLGEVGHKLCVNVQLCRWYSAVCLCTSTPPYQDFFPKTQIIILFLWLLLFSFCIAQYQLLMERFIVTISHLYECILQKCAGLTLRTPQGNEQCDICSFDSDSFVACLLIHHPQLQQMTTSQRSSTIYPNKPVKSVVSRVLVTIALLG